MADKIRQILEIKYKKMLPFSGEWKFHRKFSCCEYMSYYLLWYLTRIISICELIVYGGRSVGIVRPRSQATEFSSVRSLLFRKCGLLDG
jgi:hypothetical protein